MLVLINKHTQQITYHETIEQTVLTLIKQGIGSELGSYKVGNFVSKDRASNLTLEQHAEFKTLLMYHR